MHLRDLVYGSTTKPATPEEEINNYKFLKLPLDEPHLKIDANTRTINTKDFVNAGGILSVQGDEISEIVFFEIDRYFDATDFAQQQIAIQWKNKDGDIGSTPAFIKVIDFDGIDEKLVFGWPITSEVTRLAGPVQFTVRFYERGDGDELVYSFVTLPTTLNIGASLAVELDEDSMEDPRPVILNRLRNSTILSQIDEAEPPIFVIPRTSDFASGPVVIDLTEGETRYLKILAKKTGSGGSVNYKWYKKDWGLDVDGINLEGYISATSLVNSMTNEVDHWNPSQDVLEAYEPVDTYIENYASYYYQDTDKDGNLVYKPVSITNADDFNNFVGQYYVRCAVLPLSYENAPLGFYRADARVSSAGTYAYASGTASENSLGTGFTPYWEVPGPQTLSVTAPINEYTPCFNAITVPVSGVSESETKYEWRYYGKELNEESYETIVVNDNIPVEEGYYKVVLTNSRNNSHNSVETNVFTAMDVINENISMNIVEEAEGALKFNVVNSRKLEFLETISYVWSMTNTSTGEVSQLDNTNPYFEVEPVDFGRVYLCTATIQKPYKVENGEVVYNTYSFSKECYISPVG